MVALNKWFYDSFGVEQMVELFIELLLNDVKALQIVLWDPDKNSGVVNRYFCQCLTAILLFKILAFNGQTTMNAQ